MKQLLIAFSIAILLSCGGETNREDLLPDATGNHGEIILLMEDNLFEGPIGDTVMGLFNQRCPGPYLRREPLFDIFHTNKDGFGRLVKRNRNILKIFVDSDSTYQESCMIEKKNYWSKGQLFLIVKDSDPDRLYQFVLSNFQDVIDRFNEFEQEQLQAEYKKEHNRNVKEKAEENFGISIYLPKSSELRVNEEDFMWVKRERSHNVMGNPANHTEGGTFWIQQGILFWSEPYTDTNQLKPMGILAIQDSVLKEHVWGEIDGSYMSTEYDSAYAPIGKAMEYNEAYTVEIRGLWTYRGHPAAVGGGPFVQRTFLNEATNEVITVYGYIYAPAFNKREYIRELDAMLKTIKFV